jgi:DhnA family fructose-bisphosphate aldolase class Ia
MLPPLNDILQQLYFHAAFTMGFSAMAAGVNIIKETEGDFIESMCAITFAAEQIKLIFVLLSSPERNYLPHASPSLSFA